MNYQLTLETDIRLCLIVCCIKISKEKDEWEEKKKERDRRVNEIEENVIAKKQT